MSHIMTRAGDLVVVAGGCGILYFHVVDAMLKVSKCPDVVNRGHYFRSDYFKEEPGLSDENKLALIEFLKTL